MLINSLIDDVADEYEAKLRTQRLRGVTNEMQRAAPTIRTAPTIRDYADVATREIDQERQRYESYQRGEGVPPMTPEATSFLRGIVDTIDPYVRNRIDMAANTPELRRATRDNIVVPLGQGAESYYRDGYIQSEPKAIRHELTHGVYYQQMTPAERAEFLATVFDLAQRDPFVADVVRSRAEAAGGAAGVDPQHIYTYFSELAPAAVPPELRKFYNHPQDDGFLASRQREAYQAPPAYRRAYDPTERSRFLIDAARQQREAEIPELKGIRQVREAIAQLDPGEFGFRDIEDARRAVNEPVSRDEYIRATEFWKRYSQETSRAADSPTAIEFAQAADKAAGQIVAGPLNPVTERIPGGKYVQAFAEEAGRPTSIAAMAVPYLKLSTPVKTAFANIALQGGANVLQDIALGRTDPKELGFSAAVGGAFGAAPQALDALRAGARAAADLAGSPEGKRILEAASSERGALELGGEGAEEALKIAEDAHKAARRDFRALDKQDRERRLQGAAHSDAFMNKYTDAQTDFMHTRDLVDLVRRSKEAGIEVDPADIRVLLRKSNNERESIEYGAAARRVYQRLDDAEELADARHTTAGNPQDRPTTHEGDRSSRGGRGRVQATDRGAVDQARVGGSETAGTSLEEPPSVPPRVEGEGYTVGRSGMQSQRSLAGTDYQVRGPDGVPVETNLSRAQAEAKAVEWNARAEAPRGPSAAASPEQGAPARVSQPSTEPASAVPEKPPTIREIEQRSAPLTPEQRARVHRDTDRAFYDPPDFRASSDPSTEDATGLIGRTLQAVQDISAKIPVVRSIASFIEPTAAARSARKAGNVIPEAIVRRELYAGTQKAQARAALFGWLERARTALGLDGKGIARNVGVKADAEIPASVRGRVDDIIEHPEDYVFTAEQEGLLAEARHTFNAVTQRQLEAGVDVREIEGGYFPRIVKDSPKGAPQAGGGGHGAGFGTRPGHAKAREFTDLREGVAAGYTYENPIEAMQARLDSGIDSIAGRRTLETVKALGDKPSERVPQSIRDAYLDAKEAYKLDRSPANEKALEQAKRALRVAATKANEPSIGEAKGFGRIFPKAVVDEIAKYTDINDPGALESFFRLQRASTTTGDLSATFIQGGNLFYRNPIAWAKALAYSVASTARTPMGYVARNTDAIREGIEAGAISPPSEFLLQGGSVVEWFGRKPGAKQAQKAFEWMIFVGQTEWWKGARRLAKTPAEQRELGAVIRKATGSMLRPGLTKRQRQLEVGTLFAGRFLAAVNGLALDAARGGVRGAEARRTIGSLIAGGTALTIAGQLATDGTMPNFTDPLNRDKPWMSIKRPGGTVNVLGPLYPYLRSYAAVAQNLANGNEKAALDDAVFLLRSRVSMPVAAALDLRLGEDVVGNKIEPGALGTLKYFAERFVPLSIRELHEGGVEGLQEFPEGVAQTAGLRTSRASEYRQKVNEAAPYIEQSQGDFRAAYDAALADNNADALDIIKSEWRADIQPRIEALKFEVIPGAFDEETGLARGPRIAFTAMERKILADESVKRRMEATFKIDVSGAQSFNDVRKQYIEQRAADYARKASISIDEAKDALGKYFDNSDVVSGTVLKRDKNGDVDERAKDGIKDILEAARIAQWQKDPALFWDAVAVGWEEASEVEREAIPRP